MATMGVERHILTSINGAVKSGDQPGTLKTIWEEVTYDEAVDSEDNMLKKLTFWQSKYEFLTYLLEHRHVIEDLVKDHLGLTGPRHCLLMPPNEWIDGSFNVCLPIQVDDGRSLIARFPLPYKTGEVNNPGNADEKLRCEAAAYIWIKENCPDVPLPQLWGFAFSNGISFNAIGTRPMIIRALHFLRKGLASIFGHPKPVPYKRHHLSHSLRTGYLIMDCVKYDDTQMLSESWDEKRHDKVRRSNLFRDLSKILISLARVPLPRIGSFTIDDKGAISLTNRPLTLRLQELENEGIPIEISRQDTYTAVEPYVQDLLSYHDSRLLYSPNAVNNALDGKLQMAAIAGMRAVMPRFLERSLRHGPFVFSLTDMHQSNIFVDEQWNIKYLIDIEWACSLPVEMQQPPHWLISCGVDEMVGESLSNYNEIREEFMKEFENSERATHQNHNSLFLTRVMKRTWLTGGFFYFHAVNSTVGLYNIFQQHIQSRYTKDECTSADMDNTLSILWGEEAEKVRACKVQDRDVYETQLRELFEIHARKGVDGVNAVDEKLTEETSQED